MQVIPLSATPSQQLSVLLGGQNCQIKVFAKTTGVYLNLSINNVAVVSGAQCRDRVAIVRDSYRGFAGDLVFFDAQGTSDPVYTGFGGRYQLVYLESSDL